MQEYFTMVRDADSSSKPAVLNNTHAKYLLEAVRKIRFQRQRPCLERIKRAVRQYHNLSEQTIVDQLDLAVKNGILLKVCHKGLFSYKDPKWVSNLQSRTLQLEKDTDLTRIIVRTVRELGHVDGCNLKAVEQHIRNSYTIETEDSTDLMHVIRACTKKAVAAERLVAIGNKYKLGEAELTDADQLLSYYDRLTANVQKREQNKASVRLRYIISITANCKE